MNNKKTYATEVQKMFILLCKNFLKMSLGHLEQMSQKRSFWLSIGCQRRRIDVFLLSWSDQSH